MIRRIRGTLEQVEGNAALVALDSGLAHEVLLPSHLAADFAMEALPRAVELHTQELFEAQGQGTSFVPRLIGFASERDRRFFGLFTSVKGLGTRRALRAMARPPGWIAGAVARKDAKALQTLPEIGKRLAETVVAELTGKVNDYLEGGVVEAAPSAFSPAGEEAVAALIALGESRPDAERKVGLVLKRVGEIDDPEAIVNAAFGG